MDEIVIQDKKVVSMDKKRQEKAAAGAIVIDKISAEKLAKNILDAMNNSTANLLGGFGRHFLTIKSADGTKIVGELTQFEELKIITEDLISDTVIKYAHSLAPITGQEKYLLSAVIAENITRSWFRLSVPIDMPKLVRFKSNAGPCLRRIPFDPVDEGWGEMPTWDRLLSRMTNSKAFMAFVAAMLIEESYAQSYLWLQGSGGDGKGSIGRFLGALFGQSYSAFQSPKQNDFWLYNLLDKRCVVFTDVGNQKLVTDGRFKSLTGGDMQFIDRKHRPAFFATLPCRFIILSNERPDLSTESADMRRVIYCTLAAPAKDEIGHARFEAALWAEAPAFIGACLGEYERACPDHGPIPADAAAAQSLASENESWLDEIVNKYFELAGSLKQHEKDDCYVTGLDMVTFERRLKITNNRDRKLWHDFITRKYGVVYEHDMTGRYWRGLRLVSGWRERVTGDEFAVTR